MLAALAQVARADWDALEQHGNPFVSYAFLEGLERHGCVRAALGWKPHHVALYRDDTLVAAAPCYLKSNSHGEFVFDFAWAHAHEQLGRAYYPKLLAAVPYSPVTGPRLLLRPGEPESTRTALARAMLDEASRLRLSSLHVNFCTAADAGALGAQRLLQRQDWQFHWTNAGYAAFEDFLAALTAKRRKEIRRERARLHEAGWRVSWRDGAQADEATLDLVHDCYVRTFAEKGNHPALTRDFFAHLCRELPAGVAIALAAREGCAPSAVAFCLRGTDTLYGRYWGAHEFVPALHFEVCYYAGIEYCIAQGIRTFEPGAQGEHKIARGFMPVATQSWHWLREPLLRDAIARSLAHERRWHLGYGEAVLAHSPFASASARAP